MALFIELTILLKCSQKYKMQDLIFEINHFHSIYQIKWNALKKYVEECVAEQLTPQTPDLEVRGSSPAHRVVSLDKKLYSTFSLSPRYING